MSDVGFGTSYRTTASREGAGFGRSSVTLGCVAKRDGAVEGRAAHREGPRYFAGALIAGSEHPFGDCHLGFNHECSAATDTSTSASLRKARFGSFSDELALELRE